MNLRDGDNIVAGLAGFPLGSVPSKPSESKAFRDEASTKSGPRGAWSRPPGTRPRAGASTSRSLRQTSLGAGRLAAGVRELAPDLSGCCRSARMASSASTPPAGKKWPRFYRTWQNLTSCRKLANYKLTCQAGAKYGVRFEGKVSVTSAVLCGFLIWNFFYRIAPGVYSK